MKTKQSIKETFERKENAMRLKPYVGKGSVTTKINVVDGLTCEIQEGAWKLIADMSKQSGGEGKGPTPGTFGRAAFGSCLAMTYIMYASKMAVPISDLEVVVQVDYDARGMYGFEDVSPGYSEVRYHVKVESPAPEEALMKVLNKANVHSSYLNVFGEKQEIKHQIEIVKTKEL